MDKNVYHSRRFLHIDNRVLKTRIVHNYNSAIHFKYAVSAFLHIPDLWTVWKHCNKWL